MLFTIGCGGGAYGVSLAYISRCFSRRGGCCSVWLRYNNHFKTLRMFE